MAELLVKQGLKPIYFVATLLGIIPYNLENEKIRLSKWKVLQMVITFAIYVTTSILLGPATLHFDEDFAKIKTMIFVLMLQGYGHLVLIFLSIFASWFKSQKFLCEIYEIFKTDSELEKFGHKEKIIRVRWQHRRNLIFLMVIVLIVFNIFGSILSVYCFIPEGNWLHIFGVAYPQLITSCVSISYYLVTTMLQGRYKMINSILREKSKESRNIEDYITKSNFCQNMRLLVSLHKTLTKIARRINSLYSLHLLLWISINFGSMVGDLYMLFYSLLFKKLEMNPTINIIFVKNSINYGFNLFYVTKTTSDLCAEANKTKEVLVSVNIDIDEEDERNAVSFVKVRCTWCLNLVLGNCFNFETYAK